MNSSKPGAIIVLIALFTIACNDADTLTTNQTQHSIPLPSASQAPPDELAPARLNFQKHCIACHGERAEGGRVEVDGKKLKVPSLREGHALQHADEKFINQISEGDDEMPAFKDKLKPEEINELVRFIRKEFQGK